LQCQPLGPVHHPMRVGEVELPGQPPHSIEMGKP
jgi:hypothetical protein